jgi:RHS repeat-associated protein
VIGRHDYLPFGEEIAANTAGRNAQFGPAVDTVTQKFTGNERDAESGLDYFGARYYGSVLGRFTSVDPDNAGADPSNPQSWNAYAYVLNSPLSNADPDGEDTCKDGSYADACVTDTPPDPIQTVPFPQGPPQQPPTTNPAPVQPGPVVNPPGGNTGNCVAGFTAAGAGVGGAAGYWAGGGAGVLGGGVGGTLIEPGGGTAAGAFLGWEGGSALGAAGGFALGGRAGCLLGNVICASGGGATGPGTSGGTGGNSPAKQNKINHIFGKTAHNIQIYWSRSSEVKKPPMMRLRLRPSNK